MKMKFNKLNNLNKLIILITLLSLLNTFQNKFVKNLLKEKRSHTSFKMSAQSDEAKKQKIIIIEEHNKFRNQIAESTNKDGPKLKYATNMIQMYYSDAIGQKAQAWADKQKFMHSSSAYRKQPDFPCGENLFTSMMSGGTPKLNWPRAIKEWWLEIKNMRGKSVDSFSSGGPVTGHFTQVIWAHSYIVGCGFKQYTQGGWITQLYVCQYGPVGNIIGMPIYKSAASKTCKCDAGLSCKNTDYPGLCCADADMCKKSTFMWKGKPYKGTVPQNLVGRR